MIVGNPSGGIVLRDDQRDLVARTSESLRAHRRVLMQSPTGSGKTVMASHMIRRIVESLRSAWFICHRTELVEGSSKTFTKYGISHTWIAAGLPHDVRQLVQVCSIDTLKGRLEKLKAPKYAFIDECHHGGAAGWAAVIKWLHDNGTRIIGLSATPWRLDGSGLNEHFDVLVEGPQPGWLMERGFLSPYRYFAPGSPDLTGVHSRMGEFVASEMDAAIERSQPKLTGDIIKHWLKLAPGLRTVGFARSVAHSEFMADQFRQAGIPAAHLDGNTPKGERRKIIAGFASGEIIVLWNKSLFGEGFDLSAIAGVDVTIDCIIDAAPTQSLSWKKQKDGRALRPAPGKIAIIIDHAGNDQRHGYPDDEIDWAEHFEGRKKGKVADNDNAPPPPVTCSGCFMQIRRPLPPACPHCGKEVPQPIAKPEEIADGELVEKTADDREHQRKLKRAEINEAKTLQELVALYATAGYPNPQKAAWMVWSKRPARRMAA